MKKFTQEKYEQIKALLKGNKVSNDDIDLYRETCRLRCLRHRGELNCTDDQLIACVNGDDDWNKYVIQQTDKETK